MAWHFLVFLQTIRLRCALADVRTEVNSCTTLLCDAETHKSGANIGKEHPRHASKPRRGGHSAERQGQAYQGWHNAYAAGG